MSAEREDIVDAGCCCVCGRCYDGRDHFYAIIDIEKGHIYCEAHYHAVKRLVREPEMDLHSAEEIIQLREPTSLSDGGGV